MKASRRKELLLYSCMPRTPQVGCRNIRLFIRVEACPLITASNWKIMKSETMSNRNEKMSMGKYGKFAAMTATSTLVMFGLMYLNTYQLDHIYFSETRAYMAVVMGAAMAGIMLGFMLNMYNNRKTNISIFVGSILVFVISLWLVRSQVTVSDVAWMKAMIPHHSIAILTSERANISDPRVRKLADGIIEAQVREIAEMKVLIQDLENK